MASIKKRENGKYRARYRDEAGREHAKHFTRKVDAQAWLNEVTAAVVTGAYADPKAGALTFGAWFVQWSERQVWVPSSARSADLVRRTVSFSDVPLSKLRASHLEHWVKSMQSDGLAASTIGSRFQTVRAALKAAVRDRRIATDPSQGIRLPRRRSRTAALEVATSEQVGAVIAASEPGMRAFVGLCAFAGLRLGEASGVRAEDVDFLRRRLRVERQVQRVPGGPCEVRAPKYESVRTVYLCDELVGMLAQHVETVPMLGDEGYLFTTFAGPIPPTTVSNRWHSATKAAGVQGLKLHALRHFYASGLIAAGCDVVTVQRALGHKSASVTLNTYAHLWPTAEDKTRAAASGLASAALADSLRTEGGDRAAHLH